MLYAVCLLQCAEQQLHCVAAQRIMAYGINHLVVAELLNWPCPELVPPTPQSSEGA